MDVLELFIPERGTSRVARIIGEEFAVVAEVGAAAAGIGDDGVEVFRGKQIDEASGVVAGEFGFAVVGVDGAAAGLHGGGVDFASVGKQDVGGVAVDLGVCEILDAAGQKGDFFDDRIVW